MSDELDVSPELTALERSVLDAAIERSGAIAERLRAQLQQARAVVRTPSGVGFVTRLLVPEELGTAGGVPLDSLPLVTGTHPDLPSGAEFVLQIKDGRINSIEAFCFEGMWPRDESLFRLEAKI